MPTTDAGTRSLQDRVIKILTTPQTEWPVIEAEVTDVAKLYTGYIAILAAITALATFIGYTVVGVPFFGRYSAATALSAAVVSYVIALISVYVSAFIIDKLAPSFQSTPNFIQALKLVAYASTAPWVAGVLYVIPALGILALLAGLYAIYLFYLGVPVLMKTPQDKVIVYMIVAAVVVIVVSIVLGMIGAALAGTGALMRM
jgi:hypothetical protein